jgi:glycosyltransferase involved in cell wall biosynthesis
MSIEVSVIILTKNSEKYLKKVLESLKDFAEILIIDNGSTDNTLNIAESFKNCKIYKEKFIGFGPLKNKALMYAKNDWVLFVDSDEIVKKSMIEKIKTIDFNKKNVVYSFLRDNYYKDKLIKCCGWENDYVIRLFNKKYTKFNNKLVHESVIIKNDTKIIKIKDGFKHYAYSSIEQLIEKMQYYSSLFAKENNGKPSLTKLTLSPFFKFIKNFFFQKGFLYGYIGFVISVSNANGVLYKYLKLYEKIKNES